MRLDGGVGTHVLLRLVLAPGGVVCVFCRPDLADVCVRIQEQFKTVPSAGCLCVGGVVFGSFVMTWYVLVPL